MSVAHKAIRITKQYGSLNSIPQNKPLVSTTVWDTPAIIAFQDFIYLYPIVMM